MRGWKDIERRRVWQGIAAIGGCLWVALFPAWTMAEEGVVVSTSLAEAIARAAGAKDVRALTPADVKHPPEYELKPSDLWKFEGASLVIYAGYEKMVDKLVQTARNKNLLTVQIDTATSPENLIVQVEKIARVLKREKEAAVWKGRFLARLNGLQDRLSAFSGKKAVAHLHARPFSLWAGLSIVQIVRPGEMTPRAIAEGIAKSPDLVVDIAHFPTAKAIAENAACKYIQVINFPGPGHTKTLEDIFEYNTDEFLNAFR